MTHHSVLHDSVHMNHDETIIFTTIKKKNITAFEHAISILLVRSHYI